LPFLIYYREQICITPITATATYMSAKSIQNKKVPKDTLKNPH